MRFRLAVLVCSLWALQACRAHYPKPKGPSMGKPNAPTWAMPDAALGVSASSPTVAVAVSSPSLAVAVSSPALTVAVSSPGFVAATVIPDIPDPRMAAVAADDRGIAQLGNLVDSYMEKLSLRLSTAAAQAGPETADKEARVLRALKAFGRSTLSRAYCPDHWWDKRAKAMHALCRLDLSALKAAAEKAQELDPGLRELVRTEADTAFAGPAAP